MSAERVKDAFERLKRKLGQRLGFGSQCRNEYQGSKRRAARLREEFCSAAGVDLDERPRFLGRRHGHPNAA